MKKIITLGIMLLFLGMTISSSTGIYVDKQSIKPTSFGNILYVGGDGPGNYTKIQDAIDNASDGDTVFVFNGTYVENLVVDISINLTGEDRNNTIIDGGRIDSTVEITSDYVHIEEFTITNCKKDLSEAGIKILSNWNTIRNNNISKNQRTGVMLSGALHNIIENNTLKDNICYHIHLKANSNNNNIKNNFLTQSWHKACEGIWLTRSSNNLIEYNEISRLRESIGICLYDNSNGNTVEKNFIHDILGDCEFTFVIYITDSRYNSILNNKIETNNFLAIDSYHHSNLMIGNDIKDNKWGLYLRGSVGYHNNLVNNTIQARGSGPFDNGYPSCGNYWSGYDEPSEGAYDNYSGLNQNITGPDGIVDYSI